MASFGLRRPLHIIQPNAPGSPADAPVHVPNFVLLLTSIWHSIVAQLLIIILWCCLRLFSRPTTRFILYAMPRSGSTALVHALNGNPAIVVAGEILNPSYRVYGDVSLASDWRRNLHLDGLLAGLASWLVLRRDGRRGQAAVGFKLLDEQLDLHGTRLSALRDGCSLLSGEAAPRVVLLARHNLSKAFTSRCTAHRTGVWYQNRSLSPIEAAPSPAPTEDETELQAYAEWTKEHWAAIEEDLAAHGVPALRLYYEDLGHAPEDALRRVVAFLGLPPPSTSELTSMVARVNESEPTAMRLRDAVAAEPPGLGTRCTSGENVLFRFRCS